MQVWRVALIGKRWNGGSKIKLSKRFTTLANSYVDRYPAF